MIYVHTLSSEEQQPLEAALKAAEKVYWYRRLKVIQLSSQGQSVPELARLFDLSEATIRVYIHVYNHGGLEQLIPQPKPGRPWTLKHLASEWPEILHQSPHQLEKLNTQAHHWTLELLRKYLQVYHGIKTSIRSIKRALKRAGFRTGRSKLRVSSPEKEYQVKRERVEELRKKAERGQLTTDDRELVVPGTEPIATTRRARLCFFDETDIHWCPDLGRQWHIIGEQVIVDSPGKDQKRYLLGSVAYPDGEGLYQIFDHKRNDEVQRHLEDLITMHPDDFWFVVWDNASSHTTDMLAPFLEKEKDRLMVVFLPTYSPHLNLIERLWNFLRQNVTKNRFYNSIHALCEALVAWLEDLPFERFMSLMGIKTNG